MKVRQFKKACKREYAYVYRTPKIEKYIVIMPARKLYICKHIGFNYETKCYIKGMYFANYTDFNNRKNV